MRLSVLRFISTTVVFLGLLLLVATVGSTSTAWADTQSCAGESGHAHGHLDFLKKAGDPATGPTERPRGFGFVEFSSDEDADQFAGVLRIQDGPTSVFRAEDGACTIAGGSVVLTVSLRNVLTGEEILLVARAEDVDGPGVFPATLTLDPPQGDIQLVGVLVLVFI